jgi:predicted RNA-binding Zn-ribbon protein involved in translation (DUF1610 family)
MQVKTTEHQFVCPNHGILNREDVFMACNKCERKDLTFKDNMYLCPSCNLNDKGNFICMICDSDEVQMVKMKKKAYH